MGLIKLQPILIFSEFYSSSLLSRKLKYNPQDDPPLPEDDENKEKRTDDISSWDADFLKVYNLLVHFFFLPGRDTYIHNIHIQFHLTNFMCRLIRELSLS